MNVGIQIGSTTVSLSHVIRVDYTERENHVRYSVTLIDGSEISFTDHLTYQKIKNWLIEGHLVVDEVAPYYNGNIEEEQDEDEDGPDPSDQAWRG